MIELAPLFINLSFGEPIRVKNALIDINFKFFAFLNDSQEIFFEVEFSGIFTSTTKIFLVQREIAVFFLKIGVVWLSHVAKAKSTRDLFAKFLTHLS